MDSPASDDPIPPAQSGEPEAAPAVAAERPGGGGESLADRLAVGPTLRAARERRGCSLDECSRQLFIRLPFLQALEEGRHRDLPGGAYAAGFLRTYAEFLDLDAEELVRRFREEGAGGFTNRTELAFPSPVSEGRIPGGAVIFLGLVLAGLTYGGWLLLSSRESQVAEMVPPLPERLASLLNRQAALTGEPRPAAPAGEADGAVRPREDVVPPAEGDDEAKAPEAAAPPAPAPAAPAPAPVPALPPAPVEPVAAKPDSLKTEPPKVVPAKPDSAVPPAASVPVAPVVAATEAAPAAPAAPAEVKPPEPDGKVFGAEHADARVVLRAALDDCWVQVREMDGSILTSRLLRRGDALRLPNRPGLVLMAGNAGALEVTVDGRRIPALGAVGQVRRDVRLDPDRLGGGN
ncbi:helix-turn-helix domain-containing protein [Phaeospirillum tilakii]|uniref:Helix-turn-helix domain-containing protein n=1 Tax=Phaeospirillum tilakii TaxID=741673 RepID=A0ABW5CDJ1_9PROT